MLTGNQASRQPKRWRAVAEDWNRRFDDTIETPDGRKIKTLDDARRYL